ncbi:hypothetical protein TKK_0011144 [Trichogramma kaykai]|uniref:IQ motif and ubiquitin-like domain-containing protein n=1 Tax=Trichogramma kaykai TaxID=54128 RepID=A0ABD2WU16_9HYME
MVFLTAQPLINSPSDGWVNHLTGKTLHNESSQTPPRPPRIPPERQTSRCVQTAVLVEKETQTRCDHATQMYSDDCYVQSIHDRVLDVRPYETFEQMRARMDLDGKARLIQRCYRAYRVLRLIKESAQIYRRLREECDRLEQEKLEYLKKRDEADCRALNSPRNLADIDALLHHLETRPPSLPGCLSPRQRGLELLKIRQRTYKEIDEKMRAVREARAKAARERFLAVNCRPKRWTDCKGRRIEMTTLRNQAALELWQLYRWLEAGESKGRLELLVKARSCIDGHECRSADKLRGLLDQEIFLLSKDVNDEKLDFLRKRILGSFLQFARTVHSCRCRRVASRHEFREPLQRNRIFCLSCKKFRAACDFPAATRRRETLRCKACVRLRVNTRVTVDLKPFAYILERVREDEGSRGSLADAMSAQDVRHLVLDIWHGHSVLSECDDPRELRLPRYEASKPWSPWNCVLLTEQETEAHYCMAASGCLAHYAEHLQRKISLAHTTAKIDFRGLVAFEKCQGMKKEKIGGCQSHLLAPLDNNMLCDN